MSERMFTVIAERSKKSALVYPGVNWEAAIKNMRVLKERGVNVFARTNANGITEDLTLEEMEEIYADWMEEGSAQ